MPRGEVATALATGPAPFGHDFSPARGEHQGRPSSTPAANGGDAPPMPATGVAARDDAGPGNNKSWSSQQPGEATTVQAAPESAPSERPHQHVVPAAVHNGAAGASHGETAAKPLSTIVPRSDAQAAVARDPAQGSAAPGAASTAGPPENKRARIEQPAIASTSSAPAAGHAVVPGDAGSDDSSILEIDSGPEEDVSTE